MDYKQNWGTYHLTLVLIQVFYELGTNWSFGFDESVDPATEAVRLARPSG